MSDIYEAFESAAREQGAAVGTRLRADEAKAAMAGAALRGRQRRRRTQSIVATLAVALVGAGLVWGLPQALDQQPAVIDEDVPRIVPGAFECGEVPRDLPEPGVYTTTPDEAPEIDQVLFARWVDDAGDTRAAQIDPALGDKADARAALGFAFHVLWAEVGEPESWSVSTAGAVLDAEGVVVATHDGVTSAGNVLQAAELRRGMEGLVSSSACGAELPEGEYTLRTVTQVWADSATTAQATYVLDSGPFVATRGPDDVGLTEDDYSRTVAGPRVEAQLREEGSPVSELGFGYRMTPGGAAWAALDSLLCARVDIARAGLDEVDVLPLAGDDLDVSVGLVPTAEDDDALSLGFAFPIVGTSSQWMPGIGPDSLLLFDESDTLVAAFAGEAMLLSEETAEGETGFNSFPYDDGCGVPASVPEEPGSYTAVYVWSVVELPIAPIAAVMAGNIDAWMVLPDLVVGEDGEVAELPIESATGGMGWLE